MFFTAKFKQFEYVQFGKLIGHFLYHVIKKKEQIKHDDSNTSNIPNVSKPKIKSH